ncbi:MAG: acyl carrier protein [Actinobacteria bacterium]|nr:acyl carrier protein [Actinomycetota bacterium]
MRDRIDLERDVRRFLADNFPLGKDATELSGIDSLLEAGVIDSTGVLELVGFLEDHYSISISDEELLPENLDSVDTIVQFLQRKL